VYSWPQEKNTKNEKYNSLTKMTLKEGSDPGKSYSS